MAAAGLIMASLSPDGSIDPEQRKQWVKQAADMAPTMLHALMCLAWKKDNHQARQAILELGFNPTLPSMSKSGEFGSDTFSSSAPPLLTAFADGDLDAVRQTQKFFDPASPLSAASGSMAKGSPIKCQSHEGASWLAWSLFHGKWEIAQHLWQDQRLHASEHLDRALFECVRGLAMRNHQRISNPHLTVSADIKECAQWIGQLMKAGANPFVEFPLQLMDNGKYRWFHGRLDGIDETSLIEQGWKVNKDANYCGWPNSAVTERDTQSFRKNAACILWWPGTPLVSGKAEPYATRHDIPGGELDNDVRNGHLIQARESLGVLMDKATPAQWKEAMDAAVKAYAWEVFSGSHRDSALLGMPNWLIKGMKNLTAEGVFEKETDGPQCLWLDLIGMEIQSASTGQTMLAGNVKEALSTIVQNHPVSPNDWTLGMMRARSFDLLHKGNPWPGIDSQALDEALDKLPIDFQDRARSWLEEDRLAHEAVREQENASKGNGFANSNPAKLDALKQALQFHRSSVGGLAIERKLTPKPLRL